MAVETTTVVTDAAQAVTASSTSAGASAAGAGKSAAAGAKALLAKVAGASSPATVLKGLQVFAAAHPLAILGFVGGSLALVGLYDSVKHFQGKRQAKAAPDAPPPPAPENIW